MAPVFINRIYNRCSIWALDSLGLILDTADRLVRLLGPLLILFAIVLIASCTFSYFRQILPHLIYYNNNGEFTYLLSFLTLLGIFTLGNILYNYYRCVFSDPGYTLNLRYKEILNMFDMASQSLPPQAPHEVNYCRICNVPKPRRVHHCSVCDRCVVKMDHHCPWVNNCIGVRTYPYFVRLLFWVCSGCLYISLMGYNKFLQQWNVCDNNWINNHQGEYQAIAMQESIRKAKENASSSILIKLLSWFGSSYNNNNLGRRLIDTTISTSTSTSSFFSWATFNKYMDVFMWLNTLYTFIIIDWFGFRPLFNYFYTSWWIDGAYGCNRLFIVSYAVCICVGIAIFILFSFHLYLTLTQQTSIEFYRNRQEKYKFNMKQEKKKLVNSYAMLKGQVRVWKNPYDFGYKKNWLYVFGTESFILWILPPSWIGIRGITAAKKKARDVEEIYSKLSSTFATDFPHSNNNNHQHNNYSISNGSSSSTAHNTNIAINIDSENDDNDSDYDDYDNITHNSSTNANINNRYRTSNNTNINGGGWIDSNSIHTDNETNSLTSMDDQDSLSESDMNDEVYNKA